MILLIIILLLKMDKTLEELIQFCKDKEVIYLTSGKNPKPLTKRLIIINLKKAGYIDKNDNLKTYIYRGGFKLILLNNYRIESSDVSIATISFS
jgi:hypothetical protein